jgi:hypothetical protein
MNWIKIAGTGLAVAVLSGCGTLKNVADDESYGVAAAKICTETDSKQGSQCQNWKAENSYDGVLKAINSSQRHCNAFINGLVAAQTGTNTFLDIGTTAFSVLGTALKTVSAANAFSAAAATTSGWKTAIDSNVFARATASNYVQAIQATYYRSLAAYQANLEASHARDPSSIHYYAELSKIQAIHAQCSLASAQASISAALIPSAPITIATISDTVIAVSGTPKDNETVSITATFDNVSEQVSLQTKAAMSLAEVAKGLIEATNSKTVLKNARISALPSRDPTSIILRAPASANVQWKATGTANVSISIVTNAPADAPSAESVEESVVTGTTIVIPGQAPN